MEQKEILEKIYAKVAEIEVMNREVLTSKQAAKYLGISVSHLYRLTSTNMISHYKNYKALYFKRSELNEYMLQNRVKSNDDIMSAAQTYVISK